MAGTSTPISSRANTRVKQLRAAFSEQKRLSGGLIAIEGEHLLEEALCSGIVPETVFVAGSRSLPPALSKSVEVLRLTEDVFSSAVETRSPQGIAALIAVPAHDIGEIAARACPLILIAVSLQDPGNMGTLIRSAEAFGATGVVTTPGTVSPWNQKAIRSSAGSIFRVPVSAAVPEQIAAMQHRNIRLLAAVGAAAPGVLASQDADLRKPCAILIGNEGSGLSAEWLAMASARITVPCPGPVESLNAAVAGSLLLYEASRQRSVMRPNPTAALQLPNIQPRPAGAVR
ncbi:MAG: RNA methyltransferase [Acidobacteria bacterium]|nr:RNA methyltransferase [Acidobacteriota bacterium]